VVNVPTCKNTYEYKDYIFFSRYYNQNEGLTLLRPANLLAGFISMYMDKVDQKNKGKKLYFYFFA
jgi:hypothetical protein